MKKEFKIHDFVIGMKIATQSLKGEIFQLENATPEILIEMDKHKFKYVSPADVQKILSDPREPKTIQTETNTLTTDIDIEALSPELQTSLQDGKLHKYKLSIGRNGITKEAIDGVFRMENGTWHIPDDYIKPGIKVNCRYEWHPTDYKDIVSINSISDGSVCFSDGDCDAFSVVKECLEQNGPEWSWPKKANKANSDNIPYAATDWSKEAFGETDIEYVGTGPCQKSCDCGAVIANTTHSFICSTKKGN